MHPSEKTEMPRPGTRSHFRNVHMALNAVLLLSLIGFAFLPLGVFANGGTGSSYAGDQLCECWPSSVTNRTASNRTKASCTPESAEACATFCGAGSVNTRSQKPPCQTPSSSGTGGTRTLDNPIGGASRWEDVAARIIKMFTGLSGSVALLMFVWGGFLWMTSGGNDQRVAKGKQTLVWATIGLIIIFGSYAILNVLFTSIGARV